MLLAERAASRRGRLTLVDRAEKEDREKQRKRGGAALDSYYKELGGLFAISYKKNLDLAMIPLYDDRESQAKQIEEKARPGVHSSVSVLKTKFVCIFSQKNS